MNTQRVTDYTIQGQLAQGNQHNTSSLGAFNKSMWHNYYYEYLTDILFSLVSWENLPPSIDAVYLERSLHQYGQVAFFKEPSVTGDELIAQRGTCAGGFDIYDNPLIFQPINNSAVRFGPKEINWYSRDLDDTKAIVCYNTVNRYKRGDASSGYLKQIDMFASKLAEIEHAIQINRDSLLTPFIITVDKETKLSTRNFLKRIKDGDPVIEIQEPSGGESLLNQTPLTDRISVLDLNAPNLLSDLQQERQRVLGQVLIFLGINSTQIEKAERLTSAEANSGSSLVACSGQVLMIPRQQFARRVNECFGTDIKVSFNRAVDLENMGLSYSTIMASGGTAQDLANKDGILNAMRYGEDFEAIGYLGNEGIQPIEEFDKVREPLPESPEQQLALMAQMQGGAQ